MFVGTYCCGGKFLNPLRWRDWLGSPENRAIQDGKIELPIIQNHRGHRIAHLNGHHLHLQRNTLFAVSSVVDWVYRTDVNVALASFGEQQISGGTLHQAVRKFYRVIRGEFVDFGIYPTVGGETTLGGVAAGNRRVFLENPDVLAVGLDVLNIKTLGENCNGCY